ncbi:MAG: hypothetical protein U0350_08880 [Caldilineaceae bacterium]
MKYSLVILLSAVTLLCANCAPGPSSAIGFSIHPLKLHDAPGHTFTLIAKQWQGADTTFVELTIWRFGPKEAQPILQLRLDDWCGRPIQWSLTPQDELFLPAAAATERKDPEAPDKCNAQPTRLYQLRGDAFIVKEQ